MSKMSCRVCINFTVIPFYFRKKKTQSLIFFHLYLHPENRQNKQWKWQPFIMLQEAFCFPSSAFTSCIAAHLIAKRLILFKEVSKRVRYLFASFSFSLLAFDWEQKNIKETLFCLNYLTLCRTASSLSLQFVYVLFPYERFKSFSFDCYLIHPVYCLWIQLTLFSLLPFQFSSPYVKKRR